MAEEFLSLYETHVLKPLAELAITTTTAPSVPRTHSYASTFEANDHDDECRDRQPVSTAASTAADFAADPFAMLSQMGSAEYARWSPAAKSRALAWLCDEALSAATINDLVRKVLEARETVDRRDREVGGICGFNAGNIEWRGLV